MDIEDRIITKLFTAANSWQYICTRPRSHLKKSGLVSDSYKYITRNPNLRHCQIVSDLQLGSRKAEYIGRGPGGQRPLQGIKAHKELVCRRDARGSPFGSDTLLRAPSLDTICIHSLNLVSRIQNGILTNVLKFPKCPHKSGRDARYQDFETGSLHQISWRFSLWQSKQHSKFCQRVIDWLWRPSPIRRGPVMRPVTLMYVAS